MLLVTFLQTLHQALGPKDFSSESITQCQPSLPPFFILFFSIALVTGNITYSTYLCIAYLALLDYNCTGTGIFPRHKISRYSIYICWINKGILASETQAGRTERYYQRQVISQAVLWEPWNREARVLQWGPAFPLVPCSSLPPPVTVC